jgi:hypothetical protein
MPIRQLQGFGKSSNHLATLARLRHSRLLDCVRTDSIGEPDKGAWRRLLLEIDELHVFLSKKRAGDEIEEERR